MACPCRRQCSHAQFSHQKGFGKWKYTWTKQPPTTPYPGGKAQTWTWRRREAAGQLPAIGCPCLLIFITQAAHLSAGTVLVLKAP